MQFAIIFCVVAVAAIAVAGPVHETSTHAQLLRHEETHDEHGYDVQFELNDGTVVKDHGVTADIVVDGETETIVRRTGSYKYMSPEGEMVEVHYTADENGFKAEGTHLPKAVKA